MVCALSSFRPLRVPCAVFAAVWGLHFSLLLLDVLPVGAKDGATGFLVGFVHCSALFLGAAHVDFLEQLVDSGVILKINNPISVKFALNIRSTTYLAILLDFFCELIPVLGLLLLHNDWLWSFFDFTLERRPAAEVALEESDFYFGWRRFVAGFVSQNRVQEFQAQLVVIGRQSNRIFENLTFVVFVYGVLQKHCDHDFVVRLVPIMANRHFGLPLFVLIHNGEQTIFDVFSSNDRLVMKILEERETNKGNWDDTNLLNI